MTPVVLGLGSNVGDLLANLQAAVDALGPQCRVTRTSPIYRTAPMYVANQAAFLNAALVGETALGPFALLKHLKVVEEIVGRRSGVRFGPREIDIDMLLYGSLKISARVARDRTLEVPHPRTPERRFVLVPVHDLAPTLVLPGLGRVADLLRATESSARDVQPYDGYLRLPDPG